MPGLGPNHTAVIDEDDDSEVDEPISFVQSSAVGVSAMDEYPARPIMDESDGDSDDLPDASEEVVAQLRVEETKPLIPELDDPNIKTIADNLKANPWDLNTWNLLVSYAKDFPVETGRPYFECVLDRFPTCTSFWRDYINYESDAKNWSRVIELYEKSVRKYPNVGHWGSYLKFLMDRHEEQFRDPQQAESQEALAILRGKMLDCKAHIGFSIHSASIWQQLIAFTREHFSRNADDVRGLFLEALSIPMYELDSIWAQYTAWEDSVANGLEGRPQLSEVKEAYTRTLSIFHAKKRVWRNIRVGDPPKPPTGTKDEREQISFWKQALMYRSPSSGRPSFERENREGIAPEVHRFRMETLYTQCLCVLRFHIDIWYDFALFERSQNDLSRAIEIFDEACSVVKDSLVLRFSYFDFLESERMSECNLDEKYENLLIENLSGCKELEGIQDELRRQEKFNYLSNQRTLIYTVYQEHLLRTKGLGATRALFQRADRDPFCGSTIYIATARMEYFSTGEKDTARRILRKGYQKFNQTPSYILNYCEFLVLMGDIDNVKIIYESALSTLNPSMTTELWYSYINFVTWTIPEGQNLSLLDRLEDRWTAAISKGFGGMLNQIHRFEYDKLYSTTDFDRSVRERASELSRIPIHGVPLAEKYKEQIEKGDAQVMASTTSTAPRIPQLVAQWSEFLPQEVDESVAEDKVEALIIELSHGQLEKPY